MATELKPCPFCGAKAEIAEYGCYSVYCSRQCVEQPIAYTDKERAIEAWNRRIYKTSSLCSKCKNHYVRGGWHCWSGNKLLGFCRFNSTPHPQAKHWNYAYKNGRTVEYQDIGSVKDGS